MKEIGDLTVFIGRNGAGKTNIIESLQLLTAQSSFKNASSSELIKNGEDKCRICMVIKDKSRELEISLSISDNKKTYSINGKNKAVKDLKGILPSVIFTPDDLNLIKGSEKHRRREIDLLGSQINVNYYQLIKDYEKILLFRNNLLKEGADSLYISSTNEIFAKVASQLTMYRKSLFKRLECIVSNHYASISQNQETLKGHYETSWDEETILDAIDKKFKEELLRGRSLVGPHLDKIVFEIGGMNARLYASQGQQRSIVLALKLAEADLIEEMQNQLPVLLLDDVLSELDVNRRKSLVNKILKDRQTFITTANIEYFDKEMLSQATLEYL